MGFSHFYSVTSTAFNLVYNAKKFIWGPPLKTVLSIFLTLLICGLSFADVGEDLQKNCESPNAPVAKGDKGTCRVVVAVKKVDKEGVCEGIFSGKLKCQVQYLKSTEGAALNLLCGDIKSPVINQDFSADITVFNNLSIFRDAKGKENIVNDPNEYTLISSRMVELSLKEDQNHQRTGTISIILEKGSIPLTNVVCF